MTQDDLFLLKQSQIDSFDVVLRSKIFQNCSDLYHLKFI